MPVAADGDAGVGPMPADASNQAAEKLAHLFARRRFARTQDHRHRPARCRIVDMNWQKAALIIMGVPLRQPLVAVHNVDRVVDVQHHRLGRLLVAPAPDIDEGVAEVDDFAQRRRILPARDGRLRAEVPAGVGQASARQLEGRVAAQPVEVVAIRIAAADRQHARSQHIGDRVRDVRRIAPVSNVSGERGSDFAAAIGKRQQHHAAVRGQPAPVKRGCDFLARNGWQAEAELAIVGHGGCGSRAQRAHSGLDTHSLREVNALRYTRQFKSNLS
jgi:hypothetical protein